MKFCEHCRISTAGLHNAKNKIENMAPGEINVTPKGMLRLLTIIYRNDISHRLTKMTSIVTFFYMLAIC